MTQRQAGAQTRAQEGLPSPGPSCGALAPGLGHESTKCYFCLGAGNTREELVDIVQNMVYDV